LIGQIADGHTNGCGSINNFKKGLILWALFKKLIAGQDEVHDTVFPTPQFHSTGLGTIDMAATAIHAQRCLEFFDNPTAGILGNVCPKLINASANERIALGLLVASRQTSRPYLPWACSA
jgi:hypothetical protein